MDFQDYKVVVANSVSPIGRACALHFALEGAEVVLIDTDHDANEELCEEVRSKDGRATDLGVDPTDEGALQRAASLIEKDHDRVDVLVNAHTQIDWGSVADTPLERWMEVVRFNLFGPLVCARAFLPLLSRSPQAAIVSIGSVDGFFGNPRLPAYSTAKGGLVPLTHLMANEFAGLGVRVNTVARAAVDDGRAASNPASYTEQIRLATPLERPAKPSEVAQVVAFLASRKASYVTGQIVTVDGGRTGITAGCRWLGEH